MTQKRPQFSILALLTGITVVACVLSILASNQSKAAFVTSLVALYAVTFVIAIRKRYRLTLAALCAGPMVSVLLGGLIVVFGPTYPLSVSRLKFVSAVSILGLIAGVECGWVTLFFYWSDKR